MYILFVYTHSNLYLQVMFAYSRACLNLQNVRSCHSWLSWRFQMPRGWGWPGAAVPLAHPGWWTDQPSNSKTRSPCEPASWIHHPFHGRGNQPLWLGTGSPSWCSQSYQLQTHHCGKGGRGGEREREREREGGGKRFMWIKLHCSVVILLCIEN